MVYRTHSNNTQRRSSRPFSRRGWVTVLCPASRLPRVWVAVSTGAVLVICYLLWGRASETTNEATRAASASSETGKHDPRPRAKVTFSREPHSVPVLATGLTVMAPAGPAQISGSVVDAEGGPVVGALVSLRASRGTQPITSAVTDAAGQWGLSGPAGAGVLFTQAEAYAEVFTPVFAPSASLTIVLARAAGVRGRVVDETDAPVAGVPVKVRSMSNASEPSHSAQSDEDGRFSVASLFAGTYEVSVASAHWASEVATVVLDVGNSSDEVRLVLEAATSVTVSLSVGEEACGEAYVSLASPNGDRTHTSDSGRVVFEGVLPGDYELVASCSGTLEHREHLVVAKAPLHLERVLDPGLSVSGRVETQHGRRVAGKAVQLRALNRTGADSACSTDDAGEFTCSGLVAGAYDCSVEISGEPVTEVVRVLVADSPVNGVILQLKATGNIEVRLEPDEHAVQPTVYVRGDGIAAQTGARQATGTWLFEQLPLGEYEAYVHQPEPEFTTRVRLEHDGEVAVVTLTPPRALTISGNVVTPDGNPVIGVWVRAAGTEPTWGEPMATNQRSALTDDAGHFELLGLAPGTYDLSAESSSGSGHARQITAGDSSVVLRFEAGTHTNVELLLQNSNAETDH